jgi:hypothetical protein
MGGEALERGRACEHERHARQALDALVRRADDEVGAGRFEVERVAPEPADRVDDEELPAVARSRRSRRPD